MAASRGQVVVWFCAGSVFTLSGLFIAGGAYLKYGRPPVAVADASLPIETVIAHVSLDARMDREMQLSPLVPSETAYEVGAKVYIEQCASCHGRPENDVDYAKWMYPRAPQLWHKHAQSNVVGVSDDEPGKTFWKVKNGIRLTGMPAYNHLLNDEQMWNVTLLLKAADQPLSDSVKGILAGK